MSILLRGATLIDGRGGLPMPRSSVLIDGARFAAVGPEGAVAAPADAQVIDLNGRWLLPGLIDLHVHLYSPSAGVDVSSFIQPDPLATLLAARNLRLCLSAGVTTVRDLGAYRPISLALRKGVQDGLIPGPRIYTCGRFFSQTGGHSEDVEADGVDGVRRTVREMWKQRADLIKISVNGVQGVQEYTRAEVDAIVDEAHRLRLRVACHASLIEPTRDAVAAGVDTIEHGCHIDRPIADAMAGKGIVLVPTAAVYQILSDEARTRPIDPDMVAAIRHRLLTHRDAVEQALSAGVRMGTGTDMNLVAHPHGLAEEMEYLVRYGFSPMQAIQAATQVGAEALGVAEKLGTVEAGKLADCIVLDSDPLSDITAMRRVSRVIQEGRLVEGAMA